MQLENVAAPNVSLIRARVNRNAMRACSDDELKAILAHNRDEEKEHAAMVLEWIRRKDPTLDKELKDYLFTTDPIAHG